MPILFLYLAKLSICLAVMYLFYWLLLQRLTFYNLNRWYFLTYSFLSFFIPFINISQIVEQNELSTFKLVQIIPVINDFSNKNKVAASLPAFSWDIWNFLLLVFLAGTTIMLARFTLQWISYANIMRNAQLISASNIDLYSVDKNIIPFSFGRSVFINPKLQNPEEVQEILRHEYVHVRQKHTIDIVWTEILCLLNWYNPFVWLIRHSMRQNLEFIADNKVLENGIEKRQYQYLLLKVMGLSQFHIAASFNFYSLKKRIHMMNKMKSTNVHLVKFLFILPLLTVIMLAFRSTTNKEGRSFQEQHLTISGIVVQAGNYKPLSNVYFKEVFSKIEGSTDEKGYYTFTIPVTAYPQKFNILFKKEGFKNMESMSEISKKENRAELHYAAFIGMVPDKTGGSLDGSFVHGTSLPNISSQQSDYELVAKSFKEMVQYKDEVASLFKQSADSDKPYRIVNGHTYLLTAAGGTASVDRITDIVVVNGKKMTGKEVNEKFTRSMIHTVGAMNKEIAQKKYGINQDVMEISTTDKSIRDTIAKPPAK